MRPGQSPHAVRTYAEVAQILQERGEPASVQAIQQCEARAMAKMVANPEIQEIGKLLGLVGSED